MYFPILSSNHVAHGPVGGGRTGGGGERGRSSLPRPVGGDRGLGRGLPPRDGLNRRRRMHNKLTRLQNSLIFLCLNTVKIGQYV